MAKFITEDRNDCLTLLSCKVEQDETTLIIPDEIEKLDKNCFDGLKQVKQIILSEKIHFLYNVSFKKLESLEYIDIKNVERINKGPFFDCRRLKTIKSNNKLSLDRNSLLHCFSLKEINCDPKDIKDALGDTEIFDYPLMNKDLDVARMKIDFDFNKAKNQQEYIESWPDNFESRFKREYIHLWEGEPTLVVTESGFSNNELFERNFAYYKLSEEILKLGVFEPGENCFPDLCLYNGVGYEEFVKNVEEEFDIVLKDYQSPRQKIENLDDVVFFFGTLFLEDKIDNLMDEIYQDYQENNKYNIKLVNELIELSQKHLSSIEDYFIAVGDGKKALSIKAYIDDSSKWKDALIQEGPYWCHSDRPYGFVDQLFSNNGHLNYLLWEMKNGICNKLFKLIAEKLGHFDFDVDKYSHALRIDDTDLVIQYYSIGFSGDVRHVICSVDINEGDFVYDGLYDDAISENEDIFRTAAAFLLYSSYYLNNDVEKLKDFIDGFEEDKYFNPSFIPNENLSLLLDSRKKSEIESSLLWYTCGLKPENIDYYKLLTDYTYFNTIMPKGKWCHFLVAFDVENIILSHDFYSFKIIYDLTKNMKDEDWYQPNNFYFDESALVISGSSLETINILDEEGFNTITEVNDQPID